MSFRDDYVIEVPPMSKRDIELDALRYVQQKAPRLLREPGAFPVYEAWDSIPEDFPGMVCGVEDLQAGEEGRCDPNDRVFLSPETFLKMLREEGRARYTVMHEIYHVLRHRAEIQLALRSMVETHQPALKRRDSMPAYKDPDWQANEFASRVLMPTSAVAALARIHSSGFIVSVMVDTFKVSFSAATARYRKFTATSGT